MPSSPGQLGIEGAAPVWSRLDPPAAPQAFFLGWLAYLSDTLAGTIGGVVVLGPQDVGPFAPVAFWPARETGAPRLAEVAERALAERRPVVAGLPAHAAPPAGPPARSHGLALPIEIDGGLRGVVAVELAERGDNELQWAVHRVRWGMAWVEAYLRRQLQDETLSTEQRLMAVLDQLAAVLEQDRFDAACQSLVTELATRLDCDRTAIGVIRRGHAQVIALSRSAQVDRRTHLLQAVGAAMDEAVDQKAVIRFPAQAGDEIVVTRAHAQLAAAHGSGSVLTVPLVGGLDFTGALTFERPAGMPFDRDQIALCQSVGAMAARILAIKRRSERGLLVQARDAGAEQWRRLVGPRHVKRKLALGLSALAAVVFSVATTEYRVTAPATLEGAIRRSVAAPFDGFVATALVRAGDVTRSGAVLATLDDRDLRLERLKWASQFSQYVKQYREAVANRDRAKAQIAEALFQQAQAQVGLLDEQLSRAQVKAPFDGIVVKGDLSRSLGSAVRQGDVLFEITPLDAYRLIVEVDERDIADVAVGQRGHLVLASIADQPLGFTVASVTPVTTAREGRNFFRVEALMDRAGGRLRPGMEGVGKIEIERRRVIWIWTHRLIDWARLFVWTYLP